MIFLTDESYINIYLKIIWPPFKFYNSYMKDVSLDDLIKEDKEKFKKNKKATIKV